MFRTPNDARLSTKPPIPLAAHNRNTAQVVVYSPASFPPHPTSLIYTMLAAAVAFGQRNTSGGKISICLRLMPLGFTDYVYYRGLRLLRRVFGPRISGFAADATAGKSGRLGVGSLELCIERYPSSTVLLRYFVSSLPATLRLWRSCFRGLAFDPTRFVSLTHRNLLLGDLAASEYLRFSKDRRSSLRGSLTLFRLLWESVCICNLSLAEPIRSSAAVYALEPTYRHSIYSRALRERGFTVIETKLYDSESFVFVEPHEPLPHPYVVRPSPAPVSDSDITAVNEYMIGRLSRPTDYLPDMIDGFNNNDDSPVKAGSGEVLLFDPTKVHVVIFLHSFDDAQYIFGSDGFGDLLAWAEFTIDACLNNREIGVVMIKPHPSYNADYYPKSEQSTEWLRQKYATSNRCVWLDRQQSLSALAGVPGIVGITHHGSVAEEAVFLRMPVIAFRHASWRNGYTFVRTWDQPSNYADLLRSLSRSAHRAVTDEEFKSLCRFVKEYRLGPRAGYPDPLHSLRCWLRYDRPEMRPKDLHQWASLMDRRDALEFLDFLRRNDGLATELTTNE